MTKQIIGALIFPGFEMLDYYGPLEMYSMFPDAFEIHAVAQSGTPVFASKGPATQPDDTFADAIPYDILLVPGGMGTRTEKDNPILISWLKSQSETATLVTSVCTGSLLLAQAGVLSGRKATTNKRAFNWVTQTAPNADWQPQARWVEDGKFFTSSGVSAGMDMTLAVIQRCLGPDAAKDAAHWAEYVPNTDPNNDPFSQTEATL